MSWCEAGRGTRWARRSSGRRALARAGKPSRTWLERGLLLAGLAGLGIYALAWGDARWVQAVEGRRLQAAVAAARGRIADLLPDGRVATTAPKPAPKTGDLLGRIDIAGADVSSVILEGYRRHRPPPRGRAHRRHRPAGRFRERSAGRPPGFLLRRPAPRRSRRPDHPHHAGRDPGLPHRADDGGGRRRRRPPRPLRRGDPHPDHLLSLPLGRPGSPSLRGACPPVGRRPRRPPRRRRFGAVPGALPGRETNEPPPAQPRPAAALSASSRRRTVARANRRPPRRSPFRCSR